MTELSNPNGAVLFNLSTFTAGPEKVLDRIKPGQRGVYAWFRSFDFRDTPEEFEADLLTAIESPKFQQRTGVLAPYYQVSIASKSGFSESKRRDLSKAVKNKDFKETLQFCLDWSILLQAPLYIGKSIDLRSRISQHLKSGSDLRNRLSEAKIPLDNCQLLIVPLGDSDSLSTTNLSELEETHDASPEISSLDAEKEWVDEEIFEEIFSRLFNPSFTIRLG